MPGELYLVDSNVLIRWVQPEGPQFEVVKRAILRLENADDTPCYTSQNLGEFWNVLTRPANRNGYGLSPEGARIRAEQIEAKFLLLPDAPEIHTEWRLLLVTHSISGVQVHDARLAAAMHVHNVKRILTFNTRDFARFADIEAIHPNDLS
jgi:predicted nucleic acid-binding protein